MAQGWHHQLGDDKKTWSLDAFVSLAPPSRWMCLQTHKQTAGKSRLCQKTFVTPNRLKHTSVVPKPGHSVLRSVLLTCSKSGGVLWSALSSLSVDCLQSGCCLFSNRLLFWCAGTYWCAASICLSWWSLETKSKIPSVASRYSCDIASRQTSAFQAHTYIVHIASRRTSAFQAYITQCLLISSTLHGNSAMSSRQLYCFQLILAQNLHAALPQSNIVETDALAQWCQAMLCVEAFSLFATGPRCNPLVPIAIPWLPLQIPWFPLWFPSPCCKFMVPVFLNLQMEVQMFCSPQVVMRRIKFKNYKEECLVWQTAVSG